MDENNVVNALKDIFTRYLNVVKDLGLAAEQSALGGFIALLAVRDQSLQLSNYSPHDIEPIVAGAVESFIREKLSLAFDVTNSIQIRYDHPALYRFLVESEFLRLEEDAELLQLLDEMFPISAHDGASVTPDCIADLMVELIDVDAGQSVFDPCMGTGAFLRATQNHVRGQFSYTGADKNSFNLLVVRLKAYLSGQFQYTELAGSAFAFTDTLPLFDVVVGNPPIGKMLKSEARHRYFDALNGIVSQEMTLNFIELGLQCLNSNGKAAFLVPMGVLFSGGPAVKIRQSWLERKLIKMVVTLPGGLLHHTGLKCAIIIFESSVQDSTVRFVIAEDCYEKNRGSRNTLSSSDVSEIVHRSKSVSGSKNTVDVPYEKIAKQEFSLIPSEYVISDSYTNKNLSETWRKIGEIAQVMQGSSLSSVEEGDSPIIQGRNLRVEKIDLADLDKKNLSYHPKQVRTCIKNDILIQRIGDNPAAYLVGEKEAGLAVADTVFIIRFNSLSGDEIDFVCQFINSDQVSTRISNSRNYSVIPNQTLKSIRSLEVPLPDAKLIALVKEMNKLESSLKREFEKAKDYKRALFNGDESSDFSKTFDEAVFMSSSLEAALKLKDDISYRVRTRYPFPIAYAYRNIYMEREYAGVYERQMKYGEQLLSFLAAVGLSLVVKYAKDDYAEEVEVLVNKYRDDIDKGISPGHIQDCLQKSCKLLSKIKSSEMAQDFSQIWYKSGGSKETIFAKNTRDNLVSQLNAFKHHRGPANRQERKSVGEEQASVLKEMLTYIEFCTKWDLIKIDEINKRWRSEELDYSASLLKGDHPAFEQVEFASEKNLSKDMLYIKIEDDFICLYPLLIISYNESTRREEIFTIDKVTKKNAFSIKSFESGTSIESTELAADFTYWKRNNFPGKKQ